MKTPLLTEIKLQDNGITRVKPLVEGLYINDTPNGSTKVLTVQHGSESIHYQLSQDECKHLSSLLTKND